MRRVHLSRHHLFGLLNVIKAVLILSLVFIFINFNSEIAHQTATTQQVASNTNRLVKSQADILAAIKAVTDDTHTTAAQQTAIIICMLQVPIEQRTTDLQQHCREASSAATANNGGETSQNSNHTNPPSSSTKPTPAAAPSQSENSPIVHPGFFQRDVVSPIKSLINGL